MLKNYIITALRSLGRNKLFSLINILGLSFGLAVCILIILYTKDEVSFDAFHTNKKELYQLTCRLRETGGSVSVYGLAGRPHGGAFKEAIPEIKAYVRVNETPVVIKKGDEIFEENITWVDNNFFDIFSFPLVQGSAHSVLKGTNALVLTEDYAKKYFGETNVIGKTLELNLNDAFETFVVTGIAKASPQNSSIRFRLLASFENFDKKRPDEGWFMLSYPTFFLMNEHTDMDAVSRKMDQVYNNRANVKQAKKEGLDISFEWGLQPFMNMHFNENVQASPEQSSPVYSYILNGIALLILIIACINFVNLTIAQSLKRSKEIGMRKVIGGSRKQLIMQFLGESAMICLISFSLALLFAQLFLPYFNDITNKRLNLSYLADAKLISAFILLYLLTVFAAGFYPALILSRFDPVETLYNKIRFHSKNYLSRGLIVVQFSMATLLIISTLFMYQQFDYLSKKDLGYNPKQLLQITTGKNHNRNLTQLFKSELSKIPGVISVAPRMNGNWITSSKANGKEIDVKYEHVDPDFLPTLQASLVEGRNYSPDFPADSTKSVIVNESYVKAAGWKGSAIGKTIESLNGKEQSLHIVGVVKDYHHESLKEKISPQLFSTEPWLPFGKFIIRLAPGNTARTLREIESLHKKLVPDRPFQYIFTEDALIKDYEADLKWKRIMSLSAILTIFISCIGLFGLTLLSVQKRTKEIGLRKILGAGVLELSAGISRNFVMLILLSFVIATPLALYVIHQWLKNFAYHAEPGWQIFALSLLIVLVLSIATLAFHTIKAALANPVKNLRTE